VSSLKKHDLYNDATNSLGPRYEVLSKVKSYYAEMPQSLDCNVFTPSIHRSRSVATVVDSPTTALQHKQSSSIVCLNTINMILYCFSNNKKYDKIIHQVSKILCFLSSSWPPPDLYLLIQSTQSKTHFSLQKVNISIILAPLIRVFLKLFITTTPL